MASRSIEVAVMVSVLLLLQLTAAQLPPACHPSGYIPNSSGSIARLPDRRVQGVMPSTLPLSVLETEGATYHALFSSIINLQAWAICGAQPVATSQQAQPQAQSLQQQQQQQEEAKYPAPAGWVTTKVIPIKGLHEGKVVDMPSAVVLQDAQSHSACQRLKPHSSTKGAGTSQLLVLMRGAQLQTDYTWYAFSSTLAPAPEFGPGLLHKGAGKTSHC
jgi:hypothetical protein